MQHSNRWMAVVLVITGLQLSACQQKPDTPDQIDLAKVEYTGKALYRVRLTARKAEQLGITTVPVREVRMSGTLRKVLPFAAVAYDQHGNAWTFTNPDSLVFVRKRISVDHISGDLAVLSDGPPTGTAVVTDGAAKLFGAEFMQNGESVIEKSGIKASAKEKKSIGTATMKEDGTIRLVYRTAGATGLSADVVIEYRPKDEAYQKIIDHVGGLQAGETKSVPSWPDK